MAGEKGDKEGREKGVGGENKERMKRLNEIQKSVIFFFV